VRPRRTGDPLDAFARIGVEVVPCDLFDLPALRAATADVAVVFHLAGRLLVAGVGDDEYRRLHVDAVRNLLTACLGRPIRVFVHCSTTGVLGPTGSAPLDESAPLRPGTIYERTKAEGERLAQAGAERSRLPLVVARPGLVYGPGDLHLLGWFRAIRRGFYRVVGSGASLLHPIYIDDLVEGMLRCAESPGAPGRVYHLVGERPLPIRELAAAIGAALGRSLPRRHLSLPLALGIAALLETVPGIPPERLPLTRGRIEFMTRNRAYCGERARRELGFVPRTGLDEGLRRTVAWYRDEGFL
jgi:nucleoside-diphosphate-sugar epimerase